MNEDLDYDYDEEHDIFSAHLKDVRTHISQELGSNIVVDFDKHKRVVGIEIFYYKKMLEDIKK